MNRSRASFARREAMWGFFFISPWLVGLILFWIGPLVAVGYFSFTDYPILSEPRWVGLDNYREVFTNDPKFIRAIVNTIYFVAFRVPIYLVIAFVLALALNHKWKVMGIFRSLIYLPSMVPIVALAVAFRILLDPRIGYVNYFASKMGLPEINYLSSTEWIKPAIIFISLWDVGIATVIFLAGLAGVPAQLYEAALIDGATSWQRLVNITIPMMTPVILFNVIIGIINSFQVFSQAFILTHGGPNDASLFYVLYIYQKAFEQFEMGYAAALSIVLFVIILLFTMILMRTSRGWVQYERI